MKKIYESKNSVIELDVKKEIVYKTLKYKEVTHKWLNDYKKLSNNKKMYVEVYDIIDNNTFSMEYVKEMDTLEHVIKQPKYWNLLNKNFIIDAIEIYNLAFIDSIKLSKDTDNNLYFINDDLKLGNILVTKDMNIKVVDPESYSWVPNLQWTEKYYMNQINLMFCLQRYFYENV
jgi:serine/threonine protein kinase